MYGAKIPLILEGSNMNLSFELKSSADMLRKLLADIDDYLNNDESSSKALNCAMTAWHLTEWVYHEFKINEFNSVSKFQQHMKERCPQLQIVHDISNGTKHYSLTKHTPKVSTTKHHDGDFDARFFDSNFFDVSGLKVQMKTGEEFYFSDVIKLISDFWVKYFQIELGSLLL